ncbi:MAG: family 1 glycosylhydrolase [Patescibacteria group bacterium]
METQASKKDLVFYWGAATSSHQVEGNTRNDWSDFEREHHLMPSGLAADHYHRFRDDFEIAKNLGHNAHRFSIEWSRVEPREGEWDEREIQHYRDVVTSLREHGLEPFVTLWHWTVPLWFRDHGGWINSKAPLQFTRFAARMADALPDVKFWITLNEPNVYTAHGYLRGNWPPGKRIALGQYWRANHMLASAHKKAYVLIKQKNKHAEVGIAQNVIWFSRRSNFLKDFFFNHSFVRRIHRYQDFMGVNYYFSDRNLEHKSDVQWSIDPEGLYWILKDMIRYKKPLYIFENGIANATDDRRTQFIKDHVTMMQKAMREGIDVRGYFYWSLLDNFEWADGFWPRFGLVEINYETQERSIRKSAWEYKRIIESALRS